MNKIVNQVQSTNDHSIFKIQIGNRPINTNHVARLILSMKRQYLMSPLIVNEKMEVIDGQHRLTAQTELKLPTYFIENEGYGIKETQLLNQNSKNWTADDFMNGYCDAGKKQYIKYRDFHNRYKFNHQCTMNLLVGGTSDGKIYEPFKAGIYKITKLKEATEIAEAILKVGKYYDGYKRRSFITAVQKAWRIKEYNHPHFLKRLKSQSTKMVDCTSWDQYLQLMEKIYNFKSKQDNRIRLYV